MNKVSILALILTIGACTGERGPLGSKKNPVKVFFVPSVDAQMISEKSKIVETYLEQKTGLEIETAIPSSYVAVVEAFGTKRADVASLNTFGYILANQKYGTEALITVIRHGHATYKAQIVAKSDGPIKKLEDINGKKFAYVDPASTSGYLLPAKLFADKGVKPSETVFANKHDNVITMIYQGQVDAGATFYSPPADGKIQDARRLVLPQYPDIEKKVSIVALTEEIPNDPIVFRKDMPEEIKSKLVDAFLSFVQTEEGKKAFYDLYGVTELKKISDSEYDSVRQMLTSLGKNAQDLMKK